MAGMHYVRVQLLRCVDRGCPGFVECELVDADGKRWLFTEKIPVVTTEDVSLDGPFPQPGVVACEVVDSMGDRLIIDTETPWGVQAADGTHRFGVPRGSVFDDTIP
jgi:hypothetical protein